jgi:hypothetical protein
MHYFIHTLEGLSSNWYKEQELCKEIVSWGAVQQNFISTFSFKSENPWVDMELSRIKGNIFENYGADIMTLERDYKRETLEQLVYCY